ncbi:RICIN domain-containing protein OS=Streptomyces microflavus OX=1919 GN=HUT09_29520 PE=4 SV=1 [Streptomyces microflavus]
MKPGATASQINAALAEGKNLLFTPGVYRLNQTINVTRADTVVLGLGLATVIPENGITALNVADVDGVKIAGILIDAGTGQLPLPSLQVGQAGATARTPPTRPRCTTSSSASAARPSARPLRAWSSTAPTSSALRPLALARRPRQRHRLEHQHRRHRTDRQRHRRDDVRALRHDQQHQVIWNGNGGRTYFFQNEMPYDPPNQAAWMNGSTRGYDAYKVTPSVTRHEAWGLGSYCFFNANPSVVAERAFEAPNTPGVRFHNMVTVSLGGTGTINRVINNSEGPSNSSTNVANLVAYP